MFLKTTHARNEFKVCKHSVFNFETNIVKHRLQCTDIHNHVCDLHCFVDIFDNGVSILTGNVDYFLNLFAQSNVIHTAENEIVRKLVC